MGERSYHGAMMNVQPKYPNGRVRMDCSLEYKEGHRDARHACADIANNVDAEIATLRERVAALEADLEAGLPRHKAELSITHNEHRSSYESAAEFLEACAIDADELVRSDEIERMIQSGSIWCLQWYPHTPIGFSRRYAATLGALLMELGDQ